MGTDKSNSVNNSVRPQNKYLNPPFKPGQSGNPKGRRKGQRNYAVLYREALLNLAKLNGKKPDQLEIDMISKGLALANRGDYRFYKDTLDRLFGTAINKNDHTTDGKELPSPIYGGKSNE